ncbi:MAG: Dabb family protein [Balneolaceae bacterium]
MNLSLFTILISSFLIVFSACQSAAEQPGETDSESTVGLLQHNVYFYVNADATAEEREEFEAGLKELLTISAIYKSELGIPAATEERDVTDHSYTYAIFTWFENMDDYHVYEVHPDHLHFIDTYNHLWADVKVYDAEIIDAK